METLSLSLIVLAAGAGAAAAWLVAAARLRASATEASLLRAQLRKTESDLDAERQDAKAERDGLQRQLSEANAAAAGHEAKLSQLEKAHAEKVEAVTSIRAEIAENLQNIANESLRANQAAFFDLANQVFDKHKTGASAELNALVSPIRETLQAYQQDLSRLEREREQNRGALANEIRNVVDVGNSVRLETSRLVSALRASPKTRGRWGENTLRNVLELAGLSPYSDFATEQSYVREGALSRPDVVIRLPGGHSIVVDAKASMTAYLDAVEATEEGERERHLKLHAQQLRSQVKLLAGKAYWDALTQTPDFVVMFVPGENFYAAAVERDPELFEFAFRHNVVIATPVTLIGLARVCAYNWRQEKIAENAAKVHQIGRELYKRLSTMGAHICGLGASLESSIRKYNEFIGSLEASVMPQARRFTELEVEGAGAELVLLHPIDAEPRGLRSNRDLAVAALPYAPPAEAAR
jgi:DNA recombination protein RmuC